MIICCEEGPDLFNILVYDTAEEGLAQELRLDFGNVGRVAHGKNGKPPIADKVRTDEMEELPGVLEHAADLLFREPVAHNVCLPHGRATQPQSKDVSDKEFTLALAVLLPASHL